MQVGYAKHNKRIKYQYDMIIYNNYKANREFEWTRIGQPSKVKLWIIFIFPKSVIILSSPGGALTCALWSNRK